MSGEIAMIPSAMSRIESTGLELQALYIGRKESRNGVTLAWK